MQFHEHECNSMTMDTVLHVVPWAWIQFHISLSSSQEHRRACYLFCSLWKKIHKSAKEMNDHKWVFWLYLSVCISVSLSPLSAGAQPSLCRPSLAPHPSHLLHSRPPLPMLELITNHWLHQRQLAFSLPWRHFHFHTSYHESWLLSFCMYITQQDRVF